MDRYRRGPAEQASQAAGLFSTMRYLGSIAGAAGMTALPTSAYPDLTNFRLLYAVLLIAASAAAVASAGIGGREWEGLGIREEGIGEALKTLTPGPSPTRYAWGEGCKAGSE